MAVGAFPPLGKFHELVVPVPRGGCSCQMTSRYVVSTLPPGDRRPLTQIFTTMQLVHLTKTRHVKNTLPLDEIHKELEMTSLHLWGSGASNILLSKVSFECLIRNTNGEELRHHAVFDLKIPSTNTESTPTFSYDFIEKKYRNKQHLYAVLKTFYLKGLSIANPSAIKHGHRPNYDHPARGHDQYIRHSEQLLVAYLALPEAAQMLCNYLRAEIRGRYPTAKSVKLYNMGLHLHSTKTCCSPCEYVLLGLMNQEDQGSFLSNFRSACVTRNEVLPLTLPQKSRFQLLVTVTANENDADHRRLPEYKVIDPRVPAQSHLISVKSWEASRHIFTTVIGNWYDPRKLSIPVHLADKTVAMSGSDKTAGSPGTKSRTSQEREEEERAFTEGMDCFSKA